MPINFKESETRINLMRAFAGESQARNRYYFAAEEAKKQKYEILEKVFIFTAEQEMAHAKVFYDYLKEFDGESIEIDGGFPVNINNDIKELLKSAVHNETEEYADVYKHFGEKAQEEGFADIAFSFFKIAEIEKKHAERFQNLYELLVNNKLFANDSECKWMCLNCGHIIDLKAVPEQCPVCSHDRGYFIRLQSAPYTE